MRTFLSNCTLIDCTGNPPARDSTIVIEGDRIAALRLGPGGTADASDKDLVLDLQGGFVTPGLWSVHSHLGFIFPDINHLMLQESVADYTIRAGRNAMDALRVGITSIRSVGDRDFVDVAWKRAFASGLMIGPRLFVSGHYLCATGGHGYNWPGAVQVDGAGEMRKVVREQLRRGVDHIKLAVTGGVATAGESMEESQLFPDEIRAAVEVAHEKGKRVCVHAGGAGGVKAAIRGGVDCIEHGYYLDDEAIELMAEREVFFVPTLFVTQDREFMRKSGMSEEQIGKAQGAAEAHRAGFAGALEAGVRIACGADSSPIADHTLIEIEQLARAGMTPLQALMASTRTCAELCGVDDRLGTLEVGKIADLIVVADNPLDDLAHLRKLKRVFKGGKPIPTEPPPGLTDFWSLFMELHS